MTPRTVMLVRHWRVVLRLLAILVPLVVLVSLGLWHLYQRNDLPQWFVALAVLAAAIWLVTLDWRGSRTEREATPPTPAPSEWSVLERQAWADLLPVFVDIEAEPPATWQTAQQAAARMLETAARRLHPDASVPMARFTVPDVLRAAEQGMADLREQMESRIPGANVVRVSDLLAAHGHYRRHAGMLRGAWLMWRIARVYLNPVQAVAQEAKGLLEGQATSAATRRIHGLLARALAEEFARLAIDLYSGRFSVDAAQLAATLRKAAPQEALPPPVRVLLLGQTNAGKSSLVNALLGEVTAPVSECRTPADDTEYCLQSADRPALVLVDTAGLRSDAIDADWVARSAWTADLVVWVAAAARPARDIDHRALQALRAEWAAHPERRTPSIVFVMTHADRLSPQREWQPPYDLDAASSAKAASIRAACQSVADTLGAADAPVLPVAMRPGTDAYNIEALWLAISARLDDARNTALHRALHDHTRFQWGEVARQVGAGTRYLGRLIIRRSHE